MFKTELALWPSLSHALVPSASPRLIISLQAILGPYIADPSTIDADALSELLEGFLRLMKSFDPMYELWPTGPNRRVAVH